MAGDGGSELRRLREELDNVRETLTEHLLKCADANGRLDLKMRIALGGLIVLIVLVAPDNPIVKAGLTVMGWHR